MRLITMAIKTALLGGSLAAFAVVIATATFNFAATSFPQGSSVFEFPGLMWKLHMPSYEGRSANFSHLWKRAEHELATLGVNAVYLFTAICLVIGVFLGLRFEFRRTRHSKASKSASENAMTNGHVTPLGSLEDPLTDLALHPAEAESILSHHAATASLGAVETCGCQEDEAHRVREGTQAAPRFSSIAQQPEPLQESNGHTQRQRDSGVTPWAELLFGKASVVSRGLIARLDLRKENNILVTALVHTLGFLQVALHPFFPDQNTRGSSRDDDANSEDVPGVVASGGSSSATGGVRCARSVRLGLLAVVENSVSIAVPPPVPQRPSHGGPCVWSQGTDGPVHRMDVNAPRRRL